MTFKKLLALGLIASGLLMAGEKSMDAKQTDIQKLIEISGSKQMIEQMKTQMVMQCRMAKIEVSNPDSLIQKKDIQNLLDQMCGIYDRHFTHEDVLGMIHFYESEVGKKMVSKQPAIMQESMMAGQQWAAEIMQRVQAEGENVEN